MSDEYRGLVVADVTVTIMRRLAQFSKDSATARTMPELQLLIEQVIRQIGFRWFALMRRVNSKVRREAVIYAENYPPDWIGQIVDESLYLDCGPAAASTGSLLGICWNKVDKLTKRQRDIKRREVLFGLHSGFTVSVPIEHEPGGVFTAARADNRDTTEEEKLAIRVIAATSLDNARRLAPIREVTEQVILGPRQLECTELIAQGKTDWEIGQILGISRETIHEYIEAARKRHGVRTRTQLVVEAIRSGQLNVDKLPK